jgi:vancomycin resistance protein YoaR
VSDQNDAARPKKKGARPPIKSKPASGAAEQPPLSLEQPPVAPPSDEAPTEVTPVVLPSDEAPTEETPVPLPAGDLDATVVDTDIAVSDLDITRSDVTTPAATLVPPPSDEAPTEETLVPPPSDEAPTEVIPVAPPSDADATLSDDTTVTDVDITLSDAKKPKLEFGWLRAHKPDLSSVRSRLHRPTFRRWQLGVLLGFGALVLLFVLFVAVDGGIYYNQVHHGIKVAGQDLGGLSRDEVTAALTTFVDETREQPITLTSGDESWEVLPDDVGTTIDVPAAVSIAMDLTRDGNAFVDLGRRIKLYFSGRDIPLQGAIDDAKMDELLDGLATELDQQPTNARMVISDNQITVAEGEPGSAVDKDALRVQLKALLFTLHTTELQIPMVVIEPDIGAVDVSPALGEANTMISSDLVLTYGDLSWTLTPKEIASYMDLTYKTVDGVSTLVPCLSVSKMRAFFDSLEGSVDTPGVNATMDSDGQTVWVVPGVDGQGLDRESTADALTDAALKAAGRAAEVALMIVEPDLTTAEVEAMGIKDLLASYATTPYTGSTNRQHNVRLGTSLCSGVLMAPGDIFNTDERLGRRDAAHGWLTAPGIVGYGEMEDVYGGGICQVSTTLFNAVFEAGLEIVERYNHSIFINHYPEGRDATVTGGGKNMRFKNDTGHYIFIWGESTGIVTKFYVWGVSDGRTVTSTFSGFYGFTGHGTETIHNAALAPGTRNVTFSGQTGKSSTVTRTITWPDGTTKTEDFVSRYPSIPTMVEVGPDLPPPPTPTTAPPPSTDTTTATT